MARCTQGGQLQAAYQIKLPNFQGPLELLLSLIDDRQLDITEVSLAKVTDQYLIHLATLQEMEVQSLAEFVRVASQLILVKSRALLPDPPPPEDLEDPGQQLVQRLIEYRRFRAAADELETRSDQGLRAYPRPPAPPPASESYPLEEVPLEALVEALRQSLATQPSGSPDTVVAPLAVSMTRKVATLRRLVEEKGSLTFKSLVEAAQSRLEVVVTFLAILELLRRREIRTRQEVAFGEILLLPVESPSSS
ncbi:MAG: segregation and condensation protein A [Anaerolineae bacterium]